MPTRHSDVDASPSPATRVRPLAGVLLAAGLIGLLADAPLEVRASSRVQARCDAATLERQLERHIDLRAVGAWQRRRVQRKVDGAAALFRFHRTQDAVAKLDSALELLDRLWGPRPTEKPRQELKTAIAFLRNCLGAAQPAPLATLTVRTLLQGDIVPDGHDESPAAGAYIDVEGLRIGQTQSDGRLTLQVPSGEIRLTATLLPSSWAEAPVHLAPGESGTLSILLGDGKEPAEDTDLVLTEAVDGILPATATSFTLRFMRDDEPVAVSEIDRVELLDREDNLKELLDEQFVVLEGAIAATNPALLQQLIATHTDERSVVQVQVSATDGAGFRHVDRARFYVGRHKLVVTLAAPPSDPSVPIANIEVDISLMGDEVIVRRISDAEGRFEIDWLPEAVLAFDAVSVANGKYYYADATLVHWTDCSIRLVLRNVADLIQNVPGLIRDGCPTSPPLLRKP